jgi:hypothetical protein
MLSPPRKKSVSIFTEGEVEGFNRLSFDAVQNSSSPFQKNQFEDEKDESSDVIIYDDAYYATLLDSLNHDADKTEYRLHLDKKSLECEDERSPYVLMKPGIRGQRMIKSIMVNSPAAKGFTEKKKNDLERELRRTAVLCEKGTKERLEARRLNEVDLLIEKATLPFRLTTKEKLVLPFLWEILECNSSFSL